MNIKAIAALSAFLLLAGCSSENAAAAPDDVSRIEFSETEDSMTEERETVSDIESDPLSNEEAEEEGFVKGEHDFYISVTDINGEEKYLYYRENGEGEPASIYIEAPMGDPDSGFEYRSVVSCAEPAKEGAVLFGDELKDFIRESELNEAGLSYSLGEHVSKGVYLKSSENSQRYDKLLDLITDFEPLYVSGLVDEETGEEIEITEYGSYNKRYPMRSITFSNESEMRYFSDMPYVSMTFVEYEGKRMGRVSVYDYRELYKLSVSGKHVTPEELEEAYYKTEKSVSDWFYVKDEAFYDYALKCVILSEKNELPDVKQNRTLKSYSPREGFSAEMEKYINTDTDSLTDQQTVSFDGFYFKLPNDKKATVIENVMAYIGGTDDSISVRSSTDTFYYLAGLGDESAHAAAAFRDGKTRGVFGDYEVYEHAESTFNGEKCRYVFFRNNASNTYEKCIEFATSSKSMAGLRCVLKGEECTEEFNELVRNAFGSISLFEPGSAVPDIFVPLSDTPSIYGDESIELAEGSGMGAEEYRAYCPGIVWSEFYVIDFNNEYETGFECILEKQEEDGSWYEVLPLGEIVQENDGEGHFYDVFEEGREHVSFDLAAYPLLPPGKYRLAKPFWEKGSSDKHQYAAFYEFIMDEIADTGEPLQGRAVCEKESYSPDTASITYTLDVNNGSYSISDITDIERLENGKWHSVRTSPVHMNSIGGSYSLRFNDNVETVETDGFDISEPGDYRIRISVGEADLESEDVFIDNYGTVYGEFKIK